jgi:hypothetical protein
MLKNCSVLKIGFVQSAKNKQKGQGTELIHSVKAKSRNSTKKVD